MCEPSMLLLLLLLLLCFGILRVCYCTSSDLVVAVGGYCCCCLLFRVVVMRSCSVCMSRYMQWFDASHRWDKPPAPTRTLFHINWPNALKFRLVCSRLSWTTDLFHFEFSLALSLSLCLIVLCVKKKFRILLSLSVRFVFLIYLNVCCFFCISVRFLNWFWVRILFYCFVVCVLSLKVIRKKDLHFIHRTCVYFVTFDRKSTRTCF